MRMKQRKRLLHPRQQVLHQCQQCLLMRHRRNQRHLQRPSKFRSMMADGYKQNMQHWSAGPTSPLITETLINSGDGNLKMLCKGSMKRMREARNLSDHSDIPRGPPPTGTSSMRALPDVHAALRQSDPSMAAHSQTVVKKAPPSMGRPMPPGFYSDKEPLHR